MLRLLAILSFIIVAEANGQSTFRNFYGIPGGDTTAWLGHTLNSVTPSSDGGFLISETRSNTFETSSAILIKTDNSGQVEWSKYHSTATALKTIPVTGGYMCFGESYYMWPATHGLAVKTNLNGNIEWQSNFWVNTNSIVWPGEQAYLSDAAETASGDYLILGLNDGQFTGHEIFVVKVSTTGSMLWGYAFIGSEYERPAKIKELPNGQIAVWGTTYNVADSLSQPYQLRLSATGQIIWSVRYNTAGHLELDGVELTNSGGAVVLTNTVSNPATQARKLLIFETDGSGSALSAQSAPVYANSIYRTTSGFGVSVTDTTGGLNRNRLLLLDSALNLVSSQSYSPGVYEEVNALPNGIVLIGNSVPQNLGGAIRYYPSVIRTDNNGNLPCALPDTGLLFTAETVTATTITFLPSWNQLEQQTNGGSLDSVGMVAYTMCTVNAIQEPEDRPQQPSIYPNPATERITVKLPEGQTSNYLLLISNVLGQEVWRKRVDSESSIEINVSHFTKGLYLLHTETETGSLFTSKFVVE